jgi:hypothetical protein
MFVHVESREGRLFIGALLGKHGPRCPVQFPRGRLSVIHAFESGLNVNVSTVWLDTFLLPRRAGRNRNPRAAFSAS